MVKIQFDFIKLAIFAIVMSSGALHSSSQDNHERVYKCQLGLRDITVCSDNVVVAKAWWEISAGAMELVKIKVKSAEQGKGIGSALLQKVLCIARELKCSKIRLYAIPDDVDHMDDLLRFYKKFGFFEKQNFSTADDCRYMRAKAPFRLDVVKLPKFS